MREKQRLLVSPTRPTGDRTLNPGLCPDQESNQRLLTLRGAQSEIVSAGVTVHTPAHRARLQVRVQMPHVSECVWFCLCLLRAEKE